MKCPECEATLVRIEDQLLVAVKYQCPECNWSETQYFDTLDDETEVKPDGN